jgi:hypothetical protein
MTPTGVAKISGTAMTSGGKPMGTGMVMLTSASGIGIGGSPLTGAAMTRPDGTFTISNVTPGEYRLEMMATSALESLAQSGGGGIGTVAVPEAASLPITVTGQDISGVLLVAAPTATATGRVLFEGTAPTESSIAGIYLTGVPETMTGLPLGGSAKVRGDGTFEIKGLTGRRILRAVPPAGWFLKSVKVNDTDVTDTAVEFKTGEAVSGVEFLLTQRSSTLSGTVQDSKGQALTDYVVIAFASDSRKWGTQTRFIKATRPDQSGSFKLSALPPEDYLVVAVEYLEPGEEGDPELLERLRPSGTAVTVTEGGSKSVTLKLSR